MGLFRDSQAPSWLFGPRTDVRAVPPLIGPGYNQNRFLRSSVLCEKNMAASMRYDIESASTDTLPLFGIDELKQ
jgi:hypothetical protein